MSLSARLLAPGVSIRSQPARGGAASASQCPAAATRSMRPRLRTCATGFGASAEGGAAGDTGIITIEVTEAQIRALDLTSARAALQVGQGDDWAQRLMTRTVDFRLAFEQEETDPRELCELPEVRLWFLRLDAEVPWLPAVLDWQGGELARYTAMLIPHQVSKNDGIVYNPEALELFISHRLFVIYEWLKGLGERSPENRIKDMSKMFGFNMDNSIFMMLKQKP